MWVQVTIKQGNGVISDQHGANVGTAVWNGPGKVWDINSSIQPLSGANGSYSDLAGVQRGIQQATGVQPTIVNVLDPIVVR